VSVRAMVEELGWTAAAARGFVDRAETGNATARWMLRRMLGLRGPTRRRTIPGMLRRAILARDGYQCASCGSTEHLTIDHVVPWIMGGLATMGNLRVLCQSCNSRKGEE
jgi:5-methylcytosine-specific restriction endonuclease McrA